MYNGGRARSAPFKRPSEMAFLIRHHWSPAAEEGFPGRKDPVA